MPTGRYWRLNIPSVPSGLYAELSEVAFLDASGADLSSGGTASASSEYGAGYEASKAFDKNPSTYWSSANSALPAWIQYDHGTGVSADGVLLRFSVQFSNAFPANIGAVTASYSDDGVSWETVRLRQWSGTMAASSEATFLFYTLGSLETTPAKAEFFAQSALPSGMPVTCLADATRPWRDMEFSGSGRITGTVKRDDTPADAPLRRRVRLHRENDGLLLRETWSDAATGAYSFDYIDMRLVCTVITYDHEHNYRAVIADNIAPEAMP